MFTTFIIPKEPNLLQRLRLGLNHLQEHKLKYGFQDSILYVIVAAKLNLHLISSSILPFSEMKHAVF